MPTLKSAQNELHITSVVLKTKYITVVRDGSKFYLVNNKKVIEGRNLVCLKGSD